MRKKHLLNSVILILLITGVMSRRKKLSRRKRIQALLENHETTLSSQTQDVELADEPQSPTLPPIFNMWVTWDPSWYAGISTTTSTASPETTESASTIPVSSASAFNKWYYQDDWGQIQGPYSSDIMLTWETAGYFR